MVEEVVESLPIGLIVLDAEMHVVHLNPAAEELTGWAHAAGAGKPISDLLGPELCDDDSVLHEAARTGRRVKPRCTAVGNDGRRTDPRPGKPQRLFVGAAPIEDDYVLTVHEASPLQHLDADEVSDLSHDLRSPLASIQAYTELLVDDIDDGDPELRQQFLDVIDERTRHMTDLVVNLTGLMRWSLGYFQLTKTRFSLRDLAREALTAYEGPARENGVELVLDAPDEGYPVVADREALHTVLRNLISNGVRFTEDGGKVTVALRREGAEQIVVVTDDGLGIPDEDLPHVFQPFYRGCNVIAKGLEGTGFGLALAKAIVDAHDGEIDLRSQEGDGTSVTIRLDAEGGLTPGRDA